MLHLPTPPPGGRGCGGARGLALALVLLGAACASRGGLDDPTGPADLGVPPGDRDAAVVVDALPSGGDAADAGPASNDPFDAASCAAPALTSAQAQALLGAAPRLKLGDATLYRRSRSCAGMTPDTCGAWGAPVPHQQALLTYSGGVTTDYKTFSFPTHLILFLKTGEPRFSVRHESDYRHDASASERGVVFTFAKTPLENTYPVIYVWDFAPAPNRYEDLQGLLSKVGRLHAAEHCARALFTDGLTTEIAALYRY